MSARLTLILWACLATVASADEQHLFRTAQSLYAGIRTETLPNGLRVYLKPIPGSPVVTTMVAYNVGSADEELTQTGLSHYLEHLMFKGTEKLMPGDIDRLTQRNGGHNNAFTSEDMTVYHFDFASDRWQAALEIEADRMRNLRIDTKHEFEQEKGAVISELNGNEDEPWDLEYKLILPHLFGDQTPYGHPVIGEKVHVRAATAEIIKSHYDRWYHPNNAALVIVGGFNEKEALDKIKQLFGPIPKAQLPARKPIPEAKPRTEAVRKRMVSKFESPRLMMGFNTVVETSPDAPVLDMISLLLTNGKTSRLHKRLIEDDGTCTDISCNSSTGRYPGWFSFQAELFKEELPKVEAAINEELQKLATQGPDEVEMKRIRRAMLAAHIFAHESIHELADTVTRGVVSNNLDFVQNYLPDLMKVTPADVKRVAKEYFVNRKPIVVESVPDKAKEKALAPSTTIPPLVQSNARKPLGREVTSSGGGFDLKTAKTVTLSNGLKIILLENHRLPIVVANVLVHKVRWHEPADKVGIAALMGEMLQEGTNIRSATEISNLIADTGGNLSTGSTGGSVKVLADDADTGLDLLFDCLISPTFPKDEFESKQEQLLASLAEDDKRPETRAARALREAVYGTHPLGRRGADPEVIKKLTPQEVKQFHRQVFRPSNTVVVVVGDFDSTKMLDGIKRRTAAWERQDLPKVDFPVPPAIAHFTEKIISDANASQVHVFFGQLGIRRNNPDFFKLLVMDNILGTGPGFTDRLSASLRDRQGLAYTVRATITPSASEEPGAFTGYVGTFPEKFSAVKEGFLKEVNRLREEPPSKEEVEDAKKYLTGSLAFTMTTCEQVADLLGAIDRYNLGANYLNDYRKGVEAVTPADIQAVAKKYLDPAKMTLIAVGAIDSKGTPLKK